MALGFLRGLFSGSKPADPTVDWSVSGGLTPVVNLETQEVGRLRFGCDLESARYLGKPELCLQSETGFWELVYARGGFQIVFENNQLAYAAFFIGEDEFQPRLSELKYSVPRLQNGAQLSRNTSRADLDRLFGVPAKVDDMDAGDTVVTFCANGLVSEFELNLEGRLKRWNLYPEKEIPQ